MLKQVFMEQPVGFVSSNKENCVLLLKKSPYGLKQAPRMWNEKFNHFLIILGLIRRAFDPYVRRKNAEILIVAIFVDDV